MTEEPEPNPDDPKTGGEPMTDAQRSDLTMLSTESGEDVSENLTEAEAAERIDVLSEQSPGVELDEPG